MIIKAKNPDPENFNKFGALVAGPKGQPTSQSNTYKYWSDIASYQIQGETEIGICTVFRQFKNRLDTLERHLRTPEILIPIDDGFFLPLSLNQGGDKEVEAFHIKVGEAVVIGPGIWHGACIPATKKVSSYFVIFRQKTPFEDVASKKIAPLEII